MVHAEFDDLLVGLRQGHVKESLGIEQGQFRGRKQILNGLHADFGGYRAVSVAAHSIENQHEGRVLGHDDRRAILVVLAVSQRGNFCIFDFHFRRLRAFSLVEVGRPA